MGATTIEYAKLGARCTSFVQGTSSLGASVELAQALHPYTNAGVSRVGFTIADNSTITTETPNVEFQTLSYLGVTFFRDADNAIVKLVLPAPKREQYDLIGKNLKLKQIHGDALAVILGEKIGKTLTFQHGSVTST